MPGRDAAKDLPTLKSIIDSAERPVQTLRDPVTGNDTLQQRAILPEDAAHLLQSHYAIGLDQWVSALRYAEQRLGPVEAELPILRERLTDLAGFIRARGAGERDVERVISIHSCDKTPRASEQYPDALRSSTAEPVYVLPVREPLEKSDVVEDVITVLVMLVERRCLRRRGEETLGSWLKQAKEAGFID